MEILKMKTKELELKVAELERRIELMEHREANRPQPQVWFTQPAPFTVPYSPYIGPTCTSDSTGVCRAMTTSEFSRAHCTAMSS